MARIPATADDLVSLMGMECPTPTALDLHQGQLRVRGWPPHLPIPYGMTAMPDHTLRGRPGLRARVHRTLAAFGAPFVDALTPRPLPTERLPAGPSPPPLALLPWRQHGGAGLAIGLPEGERVDLVLAAAHFTRARPLLVARDTGAAHEWSRALRERCGPDTLAVHTLADALRTFAHRAPQHELLVVDALELLPQPSLTTLIDNLACAHTLGFAADAHHPAMLAWTAQFGQLLVLNHRPAAWRRIELHLPLAAHERRDHDAAWHTFLAAFDRFVTARPNAGLGTFVQEARNEPTWRPALLAWHQAQRIASWNAAKAAACGELLTRHRGERVLVFTPDRASAYQLARTHLVAPITAELARGERERLLDDFRSGTLRCLVGPRLLDLGVPEGLADVGILVGGGHGERQRNARLQRVRHGGLVHELIAEDTAEVGRVHRFTRNAPAPLAVVHAGGRRADPHVVHGP